MNSISSESLDATGRGYPRPQLRRKTWSSLNGPWEFALDRDGTFSGPDAVRWHAWINVPFAPEAPASGIGDTGFFQASWYRRSRRATVTSWSSRKTTRTTSRNRAANRTGNSSRTPFGIRAIRDLALEWHVIFNKGSVNALPVDVTKATGLVPALAAIGETHADTIGIGDAENDQVFLRQCGLAVAVDNALPTVKAMVDIVTAGARGAGVAELIEQWLGGHLEQIIPDPAKHQHVSHDEHKPYDEWQ